MPQTMLSDGTIRKEIKAGRLVPGGPEERAQHCTYEFLPGKIFPGGLPAQGPEFVIDWTDGKQENRQYLVAPSAMIWIRVLQKVALPRDMCGLWLQTNTLSRKGLLLVNHSLVEPGYEGFLSCHFVNFGREPVAIHPDTGIAKLLFLRLDSDAMVPFKNEVAHYDHRLAELARQGPGTFLQVAELSVRLDEARRGAIAEIDTRSAALRTELAELVRMKADEAGRVLLHETQNQRRSEFETLKADLASYLKKTFGWGVAAFAFLMSANLAADWIRTQLSDESDIEKVVRRELARHLTVLAYPERASTATNIAPTAGQAGAASSRPPPTGAPRPGTPGPRP